MSKTKKFDYEAFTRRVVKRVLDTYVPEDMLTWQSEMDNDPSDQFFSELTNQLKSRYPEEFDHKTTEKSEV